MRLNQDQIQELYTFTRKHFVEHYDLQTELVDHLANGIERQWAETPTLTFQEALNREFKKFGIFGFQDVIGERMKAMDKKYRAIIWRFYKEYFKLPKILLILSLTIGYFYLLRLLNLEDSYNFFLGTLLIALMILFFMSFRYRKKMNSKKRKWMLEEMLFNQMGYFNLGLFPIYALKMTFLSPRLFSNDLYTLSLSLFVICYIMLIYVMIMVIPPKAEELLAETYPEYKMA